MKDNQPKAAASWPPGWLKWPVILLFVIGVGAFLWQALPGAGYPKDLTRVGAGRPTLVLAHDTNSVGSAEVMELMNGIRADYAGRVDFLVAHLALPDAQAFAARHGAQQGTVLLFAADGRRVGALQMPQSADEIRRALALALVPETAASAAQPK
jgi:thioredoxin-like negative regulator of GroEL